MKSLPSLLLFVIVSACSDAAMSPAPPPETFTAQVAYCVGLEPLWVAFQDGDGAWTQAQPSTANGRAVLQYNFTSNRGGIATVTAGGGITSLQVLYGTPAELETVGITGPRFCSSPLVKTLLGSVAGLGANDFAFVQSGYVSQRLVLGDGDFALDLLPTGRRDILATRATRTNGVDALTKIILRRGIDLPDRATLPLFDFGSNEAFAPSVANLSLSGLGISGAAISTRLITSTLDGALSTPTGQQVGTVQPYFAIPEARLLPGDLQLLNARTHGETPNSLRSVSVFFRSPVDQTLGLGGDVIPPTFSTVATTPTLRLQARFVTQSEYDREASISYQQGSATIVGVSMTAAYASLNGGYDLTIPEFSRVTNFDARWALHPTAQLRWSAVRLGGTLGLGLDALPNDGAIQRNAVSTDLIAP